MPHPARVLASLTLAGLASASVSASVSAYGAAYGSAYGSAHAQDRVVLLLSAPQPEQVLAAEQLGRSLRQELTLEVRDIGGEMGQTMKVLDALAEDPPALVVTLGPDAVGAAGLLLDQPMLHCLPDPDDPLSHPSLSPRISYERQLDTLAGVLPAARRIGLLYSTGQDVVGLKELAALAEARGYTVEARWIGAPGELSTAMADLAEREVDVLWGLPDPLVYTPHTAKPILLFSFRHRVPLIAPDPAWVEYGALYALETDPEELGDQCADLARAALAGAPLDPVSTPRDVRLIVNRRAARQLRIEIEDTVLAEADYVY
jgi:putative ABC transport system substrate-binding protein